MSVSAIELAIKLYRRLWGPLFAIAVLGLIGASELPFLSDEERSVLRWVSVPLIIFLVVFRLIEAAVQAKAQLKWEATFKAGRHQKSKTINKKREFPAALYLISVLVAALGLSLIFLVPAGYQSHLLQSRASNWPYTMGEVIRAEVVYDEGFDIDDRKVQPQIVTQYFVSDRKYITREIHFNQSSSWRFSDSYAHAMTKKYALGTRVRVYYKPDEPYVAVLDTSVDWFTYFIIVFGAVLFLLGVYWFWLSLRDTYLIIAQLVSNLRNKHKTENDH